MKLEHSLTSYTKINSKWIKDLNGRPDTIKFLEENRGRTLYDINHSNILFDPPPREMEIKTKINKWDLMKLISICTTKETINKMKRQPSEWEKIFANEATDKSPKYTSSSCSSVSKKTNNPIQKWTEVLSRHFSKEDIQMAQKHMKRCSASLIIREMQIKTTMRYPSHRSEWPSSKSLQIINAGGASLVAQWLRICLLMQETRVRALVWEDPTCHGAAGPVSHSC